MRHSLNFLALILVLRGFSALLFKLFCNDEKLHFFNFNTYSRICKILYFLEKITILQNLWSISFIGNRSLFFITLLILCDEGDGLVGETVLLSTQNMFKLMGKKIFTILR